MDPICVRVFTVIGVKGEFHFKELLDTLNQTGEHISKPTLSLHLDHLEAKKIIDRDPKIGRKAIYRINLGKSDGFRKFKGFLEYAIKRKGEFDNQKQMLSSLPIEKQVEKVLEMNALIKLWELKVLISYKLYKREEDGLMLIALQSDFYKYTEFWFAENCQISDEIKTRAFNEIDRWIDELINGMHPDEKRPI